ncbi:MAG: ATP-binding cassette domain-containing protein [Candidatus Dadabacteria bacterium]|nr:metal ABC transporter ATP-binding protein [Candidatus Dadabacteria bacterium]NIX14450.1 ATP-binding cassette domain-containing protein [Candidatus Dadabacteria bacterium]NIY20938.1 ATP-binding cassette domain-containing protein [Candidatus Dadabacteria bacterium]
MIKLENVEIGYSGNPLLGSINLNIDEKQFWGIIGPNGGGKSTLLKTIIGLVPPLSGQVVYSMELRVGYVPQRDTFDSIFPISVFELVVMGRYSLIKTGKKPGKEDIEYIDGVLERVGISHLRDRTYRSLSLGEKQKALICRALTGEPNVLVLDEPTASVDINGEAEIMDLVSRIRDENPITILMASHYLNMITKFTDNLMLVDKDKKIFNSGLIEEVLLSSDIDRMFGITLSKG